MIAASDFLGPAVALGYDFWTGVPCSILTPFINSVIQSEALDYVGAASEGEAVGIAAGAHLAGRKTVVICQNSGLGNTVNPLTSLNYPFRVPTLLITTHRGAPDISDEPQHELMGQITGDLLDALRIPWERFPTAVEQVGPVLERAETSMRETGLPFTLLMSKGSVAKVGIEPTARQPFGPPAVVEGAFERSPGERMKRVTAIRLAREVLGEETALFATTGKIGRELYTLGHRDNQLYVVGSMGCASGMALGAALSGRRPVAVFDGDGALLMKMGALATIGHQRPADFLHIVLDNEAHDSTGGQATISASIDIAGIAAACAYQRCWRVDDEDALREILAQARQADGPAMVHVKVAPGSDPGLGRPDRTPEQVKRGFMRWLQR